MWKIIIRKRLTRARVLLYVRSMPQRNIQPSITAIDRLATTGDVLQLRGMLLIALLTLVLLITHGGAG
jgi:hypothetical protein